MVTKGTEMPKNYVPLVMVIEAPDYWFSQGYLHVAYDGEAFSLSLEAS